MILGGKSPSGPQSQVETPEKSCGNHPIGEISRYLTGFIIELNVDCLGRKKNLSGDSDFRTKKVMVGRCWSSSKIRNSTKNFWFYPPNPKISSLNFHYIKIAMAWISLRNFWTQKDRNSW